jgi:hypothetical protein
VIDQIDDITDQIFDILCPNTTSSSQSLLLTPIQKIIIEETGKVLGAGTRMMWSQVRNRSGKLPNGRTLLGSLLDPLGLFSGSNLIGKQFGPQ